MPFSSPSQRGASRSGRSASSHKGTGTGGSSARARASATASSSPRKPRTTPSKSRKKTGAVGGARRSKPRAAPRKARGPLLPIAILGAIALLVWSMYPALKVQYETGRRLAGLERQYKDLSDRNQVLRAQVADLKTPEGVEKAARESLGLVRPGENVYVVMDPSKDGSGQSPATSSTVPASAPPDAVTAFLDAIFGIRR
ncbi:MAG: septum formation initiator family protein [Coriobacteriia bacterium]|nr:septum formation initiator family protein [Coriobacteriia bacterium]